MNIEVRDVMNAKERVRVEFASKYGEGVGIWTGDPPPTGKEYVVELGCEETLHLGQNAELATSSEPCISHDGFRMTVTAAVEELFENNTASLRLGDSLFLVDYEGEFPSPDTWIRVCSEEFELNDVDV